jgi:hypothetical protein
MNILPAALKALLPSMKEVAGALSTGALMEVGSSLVKNVDVTKDGSTLLGFAKDVGMELLGQKALPLAGDDSESSTEIAGAGADGASKETPKGARRVPLAARPGSTPVEGTPEVPEHARIPVGGSRTYMMGKDDTTQSIAVKYGVLARPNWQAELAAENPGVDLEHADRLVIPNSWPTVNPSAAAPMSGAPAGAPAVSGAVRTVCTCALSGAAPVLAGPGERIELKQCDACRSDAIKAADHHVGMTLGWAEAWKKATGVDPLALGDSCGARPDRNGSHYNSKFGFDGNAFNRDIANWQSCMATRAIDHHKKLGKATPAATPAAPAAPAAPASSAKDTAALVVSQQARRADKQAEALKTQMEKAPDGAGKEAIKKELDRTHDLKRQAEAVADHIAKNPADERLVHAVHEHAEKGPEVVASMIPMFFAMLNEGFDPSADPAATDMPPWGGPPPSAASAAASPSDTILDFTGEHAELDFPSASMVQETANISELPELSVQGAQVAPPSPAPVPAAAPPLGLSMEPSVESSMEPVEANEVFDDTSLAGLDDNERDLVRDYVKAGYAPNEIQEFVQMFRAQSGNTRENPGQCDQGCPLRG